VIKPLPSEDGSVTATAFEIVHRDEVLGKLTFYDRMIFKGHLVGLIRPLGMKAFLDSQGVLLKDYGGYVKAVTDALKAHVQAVAAAAGAPYRYLHQTHTKAAGRSKEDLARQIATERGMATGLVCVLAAVEPCSSFDVGADVVAGRLAVRRRPRKCLHFYFYLLHPTLGGQSPETVETSGMVILLFFRSWMGRASVGAGPVPARV
jgi:hypothetical protein